MILDAVFEAQFPSPDLAKHKNFQCRLEIEEAIKLDVVS